MTVRNIIGLCAVLCALVSYIILKTGVLPKWIGWLGILAILGAIFGVIFLPFLATLIWFLIIAIVGLVKTPATA